VKHLVGRGYALTACGLTSILPGELTARLESVTHDGCRSAIINRGQCPECGERGLSWNYAEAGFYLTCDACLETLLNHVQPAVVAAALTKDGWRP
jgi:NADH pyrophosphatase NudC (nudix superfamily)